MVWFLAFLVSLRGPERPARSATIDEPLGASTASRRLNSIGRFCMPGCCRAGFRSQVRSKANLRSRRASKRPGLPPNVIGHCAVHLSCKSSHVILAFAKAKQGVGHTVAAEAAVDPRTPRPTTSLRGGHANGGGGRTRRGGTRAQEYSVPKNNYKTSKSFRGQSSSATEFQKHAYKLRSPPLPVHCRGWHPTPSHGEVTLSSRCA